MSFPDATPTPHHVVNHPVSLAVADILRAAATYLQRHGWVQGRYYATTNRPHPKACALGAIAICTHGQIHTDPDDPLLPAAEDYQQAITTLACHLNLEPDGGQGPAQLVCEYNDDPTHTADHITAALNAAANRWHQ